MGFYFCGRYINTDADDKNVERDMYAVIPYFRVSEIILGMRCGKMILKDSLVILFWHPSRNAIMPKWRWLDKFIGGEKIAISTISVNLSYKIIFVFCMLHTFFMHLRQITIIPMLSKSPGTRADHSPISALSS